MGFFRNVAGVLAASVVAVPIAVLTSVVLARGLSVPDRGLYALLTTFSTVLFLLTQLGWAEASIYRTRRLGVSPRRSFSTGLLANLAITGAAVAVALLAREPLSRLFLDGVGPGAFALAAVAGAMLTLGDFERGVARALDRFDLHNAYALIQGALTLIGLVVVLGPLRGALDAALLVFMAVQLVLAVCFGVLVGRLAGFEPRFDPGEASASLRYGANLHFQNICIHLHERVDLFLLAALGTSAHDVGLYAAAVSVVAPLRLLPSAIGTVLLPQLAGARDAEAAEFTARVARQTTLVMVVGALAILPLGVFAIPLLFGREYEGAVTSFLVLTPGMAALALSRVLSRYFAAVHRQRALLVLRAASLAANVVLNLVLIPSQGIVGAALASLLSYGAEALGIAWLFLADSGRSARDVFLPRTADVAPLLERMRR